MAIDWFTFVAQVLNFVVLVWLLKRFLYQPILDAVAAREQRIAAELADADSIRDEADRQREEFVRKNAEFEAQKAGMLEQAESQAKAEYRRLVEAARESADALSSKRSESLRKSFAELRQGFGNRVQQQVFAVSQKVLSDLTDAGLEAQIAEKMIERLGSLDEQDRQHLRAACESARESPSIRSAFELADEQRAALATALGDVVGAGHEFRFETEPGLIGGIEIVVGGQKLAWSIADYLGSLKHGVEELAEPAAESQPRGGATHRPDPTHEN